VKEIVFEENEGEEVKILEGNIKISIDK